MFQFNLFLGFPVEKDFSTKLNSVNLQVRALFIQEDPSYLRNIACGGKSYLGKFVGKKVELAHLELLEKNIYSLLRKLVPDFPYDKYPLELIPIPENE